MKAISGIFLNKIKIPDIPHYLGKYLVNTERIIAVIVQTNFYHARFG